ncbi:class I SAM-dependent methyltransferase [Candidatus Desulfatibia sp.]|uniref:class I SAM-dependent methyltransferase n=1 Tax=Candidatus Desulfatibia sp. TaxID=3101189 RepID=UPI0039B948D7
MKKLIESGAVSPCKALDVGCGEGFYSIYLASNGFDVVGIDLSEHAIEHARRNAIKESVDINFKAIDIADLNGLNERFDFVLEWSILHHIAPSQRPSYVEGLAGVLNPKGMYLSVCFSDKAPEFKGDEQKVQISPVGTKLYYSSQPKLQELFQRHFEIIEFKLTTIKGRFGQEHVANYCVMKKR